MPGPGQIENNTQSFKLTIESFTRANAARPAANAPRQLANAQGAQAPEPVVAQAQPPRRGFFGWFLSLFKRAEAAPAPAPVAANAAAPEKPAWLRFNDKLEEARSNSRLASGLPDDFKDAVNQLVDQLRAQLGDDIVPPGATIDSLVNKVRTGSRLKEAIANASAGNREVAVQEIVNAYKQGALENLAFRKLGEQLLAKAKTLGLNLDRTPIAIGSQLCARYPEIGEDFKNCTSPAQLQDILAKYDGKMESFLRFSVKLDESAAGAMNYAKERFAQSFGLAPELLQNFACFYKLSAELVDLSLNVTKGVEPGSKEEGYDVNAAFRRKADAFIQARTGYCNEIDALEIDEQTKNSWKAEILQARDLFKLRPAQIVEVMRAVDVKQLSAAFDAGLPMSVAGEMIANVAAKVSAKIQSFVGAEAMRKFGADDISATFNTVFKMVFAANPGLRENASARSAGFLAPLCSQFQSKNRELPAQFVSAMVFQAKPRAENPILSVDKFNRLVENEVKTALAQEGVADAKVAGDVKAAMLERTKGILSNAGTLTQISASLPGIRSDAAALAKSLSFVQKAKATALNASATTISLSTGLSKNHVLNNLNIAGITSNSGKLHFLYKDIIAKAKTGEAIDPAFAVNQANKIAGKFASDKTAVIKSIDDAGFLPAEAAQYKIMALREGAWKNPDIARVAKQMSQNAAMKSAMNTLADVIKPDLAANLDDGQLRDVFLVFAAKFTSILKKDFEDFARSAAGEVESINLLQHMLIDLLVRERPDFAVSLAKLGASGRLASLDNMLTAGMNSMKTVKMDYLMLKQYSEQGLELDEQARKLMNNPGLTYSEKDYMRVLAEDESYIIANTFSAVFSGKVPPGDAVQTEKTIARLQKGPAMIEKYGAALPQEAIVLLQNLVDKLDWRDGKAEKSEAILKDFAEDMKTWRDVAPGSKSAEGLANFFKTRTNNYLADALSGLTKISFADPGHPDIAVTMISDLPRCNYRFNGKKPDGEKTAQNGITAFCQAVKDPAARKTISILMNQQIFGDFTASVGNRLNFDTWKAGMEEVEPGTIPGIENFASRPLAHSMGLFFGTGPMTFELQMAEDGKSAKISATSEYPIRPGVFDATGTIGNCVVVQSFTVDLGEKPSIRDYTIGQTFKA